MYFGGESSPAKHRVAKEETSFLAPLLSLLLPSSATNRRAPRAHAPAHDMLFASEWVAARNKEVWLPIQHPAFLPHAHARRLAAGGSKQPKLHHLFIQLGGFYSLQVMLDAAQSH
jgi:hypothetical protein